MFNLKKYLILILAFLGFAGLYYVADSNLQINEPSTTGETVINNSETLSPKRSSKINYNFEVELYLSGKQISVKQDIVWVKGIENQIDFVYINLFPNAYSNNKTNYMLGKVLPEECQTRLEFNKVEINGIPVEIEIEIPFNGNKNDSTIGRIAIPIELQGTDNLTLHFEYNLAVPKAIGRFGYESEGDFIFFAQWFPRLAVFENSKWDYTFFHSFVEFNYDFADFYFNLKIPNNFSVAATGDLIEKKESENFSYYSYQQINQIDFAWCAALEYKPIEKDIGVDGKSIKINLFQNNLSENRIKRILSAAENGIKFLSEKIGKFPYEKLTLVAVPNKDSRIANMEYPSLITFANQYFSPEFTLNPEETIIHEIVHQYFYASVVNDESKHAWLDEGFANYLTSKILEEYYPDKTSYFRLFGEVPIQGLLLHELEQVPLIYSLAGIKKPAYINSLSAYYKWGNYASLVDTSLVYSSYNHYTTHAYSRGELFLKNIENLKGEEKLYNVLQKYFNKFKGKRVNPDDFLAVLKLNSDENDYRYIKSWYLSNVTNDFKIVSILKDFSEDTYNLLIEKEGDILFPIDIEVHTAEDTLKLFWDGNNSHTNIRFKSKHDIVTVILDPTKKNLYDKDFANNSLTTEMQLGGAISISLRFFFWVQNFLMVFGGFI